MVDADMADGPDILTCGDGRTIAYRRTPGRSPGIVFLPGLRSDMTGAKAVALEAWAAAQGRAFLRFDYTGHGASSGRFAEGTIGAWHLDTLTAIDRLTEGRLVLVGSSMGGWQMLLAARERRARIAGLVGIAAAADFTDRLEKMLAPEARAALRRDGIVQLPSLYSPEPTPITAALIEDGKRHRVLDGRFEFDGPVRLIHGVGDPDVPWRDSLTIAERVTAPDTEVILVKDGDHRLSAPRDIERLIRVVAEVCGKAR
jgi:pimeloyl-ACP methyl ester carboxylesterase